MASWRRGTEGVPERLARFVPSEWPGAWCQHEALQRWQAAALAWEKQHPDSLPFGEHGDFIDVLREVGRLRRDMPACSHEWRPASWQGRGA